MVNLQTPHFIPSIWEAKYSRCAFYRHWCHMDKNYNVEICCTFYTDADLNLDPVPPPADLDSTLK